jgi:hypothetical protein
MENHRTPARLLAAALALFAVGALPARGADALTAADGQALVHAIRSVATPGLNFVDPPDAPLLDRPDTRTLIVALYDNGPALFQCETRAESLRAAAREAGEILFTAMKETDEGLDALLGGRLCVDVVLATRPLKTQKRLEVGGLIELGREGLLCEANGQKTWLTPVALLRQSRKLDVVRAAFAERRRELPAGPLTMARLKTATFAEARPGGTVEPVVNGNVLIPFKPDPTEITQAAVDAGLALLKTQREDGAFLVSYSPVEEKPDIRYVYDIEAHMRATLALSQLFVMTESPHFEAARDKALRHAESYLERDPRHDVLYLKPDTKAEAPRRGPVSDEISATALYLTTLCTEELRRERPTAGIEVRRLGNYLCTLVDDQGALHHSLLSALRGEEAHVTVIHGAPYAEAIIALCMLERISPREDVRATIRRLIDHATAFRPSTPPAVPRTTEALGQAYLVTRDPKLGEKAFGLGLFCLQAQLGEAQAEAPDEVGGFIERDMRPQAFSAARAISAMAAAYHLGDELEIEEGKGPDFFPVPMSLAARFLMNMQFRRENTFYLRDPEIVLGGFRKGTNDLTMEVKTTAGAVDALLRASLIIAAENAYENPGENPPAED